MHVICYLFLCVFLALLNLSLHLSVCMHAHACVCTYACTYARLLCAACCAEGGHGQGGGAHPAEDKNASKVKRRDQNDEGVNERKKEQEQCAQYVHPSNGSTLRCKAMPENDDYVYTNILQQYGKYNTAMREHCCYT